MNGSNEMKSIGDLIKRTPHKPRAGIHTELHDLIDQLRTEYGETATKGVGSFSFYLGMLKGFSISFIYGARSQAKEGKSPKKLFWWICGQERKREHNK